MEKMKEADSHPMWTILYRDGISSGNGRSLITAPAPVNGSDEAMEAFAKEYFTSVQDKYSSWLATLPHENSSEKQEVNILLNRCASRQKKRGVGGGKKKEVKKPQPEEQDPEEEEGGN